MRNFKHLPQPIIWQECVYVVHKDIDSYDGDFCEYRKAQVTPLTATL
jgi:hypothetical protein